MGGARFKQEWDFFSDDCALLCAVSACRVWLLVSDECSAGLCTNCWFAPEYSWLEALADVIV